MALFPTNLLLATDASEETQLAARSAIEVANRTGTELHIVHVVHEFPVPHCESEVPAQFEKKTQETLLGEVKRIEGAGGGSATHLRMALQPSRS